MKEFAAAFLLISFLGLNVTFIWMIWSNNQLSDKSCRNRFYRVRKCIVDLYLFSGSVRENYENSI